MRFCLRLVSTTRSVSLALWKWNAQPLGRHDRSCVQRLRWKSPTLGCSGSPLPVTQPPVKEALRSHLDGFPRGGRSRDEDGRTRTKSNWPNGKGTRKVRTFPRSSTRRTCAGNGGNPESSKDSEATEGPGDFWKLTRLLPMSS